MSAHPSPGDALEKVVPQPFKATCHRIVALHAYEAGSPQRLLYDLGPKLSRSGQRFSPPGDHAGLYVAVERLTAGAEFAGSVAGWNESGGGTASVVFKLEVKLQNVLNLADTAVLETLGITLGDVQGAWEGFAALFGKDPFTWELGRAVFKSGRFDGILFPSTKNKPDGLCLLVFTERLMKGKSGVALLHEDGSVREQLPL